MDLFKCQDPDGKELRVLMFNLFMPSGLFYINYLDWFISKRRDTWLIFITTILHKTNPVFNETV